VDFSGRITGYGVYDLRTLERCDWRLSVRNVWKVERTLIEFPHAQLRTSDRRYRAMLARYRAFKREYPDEQATFYKDRHLWL